VVTGGGLSQVVTCVTKLVGNIRTAGLLCHTSKKTQVRTSERSSIRALDLHPSLQPPERPQARLTLFFPTSSKMGLSGRKIKQRIPQDPRNLSWVDGSADALTMPSTFIAQPSMHRCVSLWFYISIQARLRSHRQKCHPRNLRSGPHPASQGKVHVPLYPIGLSRSCCIGASQTRRARYRGATYEGS